MIQLQFKGDIYDRFSSINADLSMDEVAGSFSFEAVSDSKQNFPFKVGDKVKVLVDETVVITGFIDVLDISYSSSSHTVSLSGRGGTNDLIDSTLGIGIDFSGDNLEFTTIIRKILDANNSQDINIINLAGDIEPFRKDNKVSASIGDGVFSTIEKYARKKNVLVTSNGDGDLVLSRGKPLSSKLSLINTPQKPDNCNIVSASCTYDESDIYSEYTVKSQKNLSADKNAKIPDLKDATDQTGSTTNSNIRKSRKRIMRAETSSNSEQCKKRAQWQANIDKARSFTYSVSVGGHTDINSGEVWTVNKAVAVDDKISGVEGNFLISKVSYSYDLTNGSTTKIDIADKDAYTLELNKPTNRGKI